MKHLKRKFIGETTTYIIAKYGHEIVGFAGIKQILDEADVMNIVTKKTYRKMGIGALLLHNLINIAKEKNMKTITLEVNENNIPAINLYKKFNFEQVGLRKKYYNNADAAILMTLCL